MYRRRYLATATALAASLAGCGGGDSTADDVTPTSDGTTQSTESTPTTTTETTAEEGTLVGVSLSPRSYGSDDFSTFFETVTDAGMHVRWAGDWNDLEAEGGGPRIVSSLTSTYGHTPIIEAGVYSVGAREFFRPFTAAQRETYVEQVRAFADVYEPPYLGLGVEVNIHATEDPDGFEEYVAFFADAAAAVHDVSPDTVVSVGVQYEWLLGLRGGLFGGENDPDTAQWSLLDRFPDADQVTATSFPGLHFTTPADIPADHYTQLRERVDRPVAITETGWHADTITEDWPSSEAAQVAFVDRLPDLLAGLDPTLLCWLWAHSQGDVPGPFGSMTLFRPDGTPRPVWDAWTTLPDRLE